MKLLFLHGAPAVGKLTVARDLAALTGLRLFHNHLTVDLVSSLFAFGSEPFILLNGNRFGSRRLRRLGQATGFVHFYVQSRTHSS